MLALPHHEWIACMSSREEVKPIIPGLYQHYKGGLYEVLGTGRHSESLEELVFYRALNDSADFGEKSLWGRPVSMFRDVLEIENRVVPRFRLIKELHAKD